jgi:hypothetical protein
MSAELAEADSVVNFTWLDIWSNEAVMDLPEISLNAKWFRLCPNDTVYSIMSICISSFAESIFHGKTTCTSMLKVIWARRNRGSSCPVLFQCARKSLLAKLSCRFISTVILAHAPTFVIAMTVIKHFVLMLPWRDICASTMKESPSNALRWVQINSLEFLMKLR